MKDEHTVVSLNINNKQPVEHAHTQRTLKSVALEYLANQEIQKECPSCSALMPPKAHFCYECGNTLSKGQASLAYKITRNMIIVVCCVNFVEATCLIIANQISNHYPASIGSEATQTAFHK